jgi:exopolyphosphatase/guanosine-5'-triphosphate,3'-diphosphate pyrophosphatase
VTLAGAHVGVIDIGSNSIRLVVYDRLCRAPVPRFNEKSLCALGKGLEDGGRLDPEAAVCALHILNRFGHLADAMGAVQVTVVATEAVRRARDGADFLARAEALLGRPINVLSGDEEARLAALGVAGSFWQADGVVADLGGGSLELSEVGSTAGAARRVSLPLGTLRVARAVAGDAGAARRRVDAALDEIPWLDGAARGREFYVVGGGWRALARIHLAISRAPLPVVNGYTVMPDTAQALAHMVGGLDRAGILDLPGLPRRRAETLPAAALLLDRVIARLDPARVVFSAVGLREGVLFAALPADELVKDPLIVGAHELGRARSRAPGIGPAMASWTASLFRTETVEQARLREAACAVSDVGWLETRDSRARDAFFMLAHYPFLGVRHPDRVAIAYAVFIRYEGTPDDPPVRPLLAMLPESERQRAESLGRALQLGYRLCGGAPAMLQGSMLRGMSGEIRLELSEAVLAPEGDSLKVRLRALARSLGVPRWRIVAPDDSLRAVGT